MEQIYRLTRAIEAAVRSENWYAALGLALMMPDLCASLSYPEEKQIGTRYEHWFWDNLAAIYGTWPGEAEFLSASDCYALRCAYLHNGQEDITGQRARDTLQRFHFTTEPLHLIRVNDEVLALNIAWFCEEIVGAVKLWATSNASRRDLFGKLDTFLEIHVGDFSPAPGILFCSRRPESAVV